MGHDAFLAREALIARANIDEDWLASLGLALVPLAEVTDEGHKQAAFGELLRVRGEGAA